MNDAPGWRQSWFTPAAVLRRWNPAAFAVFLSGYLLSARIFFHERPFTIEQAVMSAIGSRTENPHGYGYAALSMVVGGGLMLPMTALFRERLGALHPRWCRVGVGLLRAGLVAAIALGAMAPFESDTYNRVHINIAFLVFLSLSAGLAVSLSLAACRPGPWRGLLIGLAVIQGLSLGFVGYIYMVPYPHDGYGPWTSVAALEWELAASFAICLTALAAALQKPVD